MIRLFGLLWHGCWHVWEPQSQGYRKDDFFEGPIVYCACKHCGRWTSFVGTKK